MNNWKLDPAHDLGLPLKERARSLRREDGLLETLLHATWWSFVRGYLAVYHRLEIVGRENIPAEPPFVLVANHSSHLDALALAAALPARLRLRVFPIAAGDTFFETPAAAAFAAFVLNALPMWRRSCGPHALRELRERLINERCAYILFPEGTRTRDGCMNAFKPGIGMLVAGTQVPVVPGFLDGCFLAWPPQARLPRPRKVGLRIGQPVWCSHLADERSGWERATAELEAKVRALGGPSRD
ncbi:MAG: 1-acyl-sn-glycerol-3-phosphate acyltransferase [Verrucomicrobia bacterium]|nr:1-acyl-sn-glycerol-3-phosphate acyltransferase [Verrucomicrobiota bacterium]